jgi:tetratricopeptide (TPR) repeat protein
MAQSAKSRANAPESVRKLVSWKAIAEYLGCDVRTAKRWERDRQMPVFRAPGNKRSSVFAYTTEIDNWLEPSVEPELPSTQDASDKAPTPPTGRAHARTAYWLLNLGQISSGWRLWGVGSAGIVLVAAVLFFATLRLPASHHAVSVIPSPQNVPAGAEQMYLRGRYYWNLRTADSLTKAIDAYTQAIVKDPSYAEAYAGLAEAYDLLPQFAYTNPGASFMRAKDAADRAIQLNPDLASAHRAKGFALLFWDWDIAGSDAEFLRALALDPGSAQTHQWYASTLQARSESVECLKQIDEALRLDPTSTAIAADAAFMHADFRDNFSANIQRLAELERTQSALLSPSEFRAELAYISGDFPTYVAELRRIASITKSPDDVALARADERGWSHGGKRGLIEAQIAVEKAAIARDTDQGFWVARDYIALGEAREALPYFRSGLDRHQIPLMQLPECPWADKLANHDPRYASLLNQIRQRLHSELPHPQVVPLTCRIPQ